MRGGEWTEKFLEILRQGWSVSKAAKGAGINLKTVWGRRKGDPEFAAAYDMALEEGADVCEDVAFERGIHGGSDKMLEMILKARRPEKYTDKHKVEMSRAPLEEAQAEFERLMNQVLSEDAIEEPKRITDGTDRKD